MRTTKAQNWDETLEELRRRRGHAHARGGPERLAKHHGKGKLNARAHLLDKGSFRDSARWSAETSRPTGSSPDPDSSTAPR